MEIYYQDHQLTIRAMQPSDAQVFCDTYLSYGWHPDKNIYDNYYKEQESGIRKVFIAAYEGNVAGICTLVPKPENGPWAQENIPEIVDLSVFNDYRKKGIGNKLLETAENEAFKQADAVCLAVGIHSGYGNAQRIYVKRGYNFDGSGVWYHNKPVDQYASCINDDNLVLYMSKETNKPNLL